MEIFSKGLTHDSGQKLEDFPLLGFKREITRFSGSLYSDTKTKFRPF